MSLMTRRPSAAQSAASRANSRRSTGPDTPRGKAMSKRNGFQPRRYSAVEALNVVPLGEDPADFEQMRQDLSDAMRPRDAWESAWVLDVAVLRWRLWRLHRAEAGALAARKQKLRSQRRRADLPASGATAMGQRMQIKEFGFTGLPDSAWKFEQVLDNLHEMREQVAAGHLNADGAEYFTLLYGKTPSPQGIILTSRFEVLAKRFESGDLEETIRVDFLADLDAEISAYEGQQELYEAEHAENPVRQDADLMLPDEDMDKVIRYEAHLEDQIERKLRQFYARRRESAISAEPGATSARPAAGAGTARQIAGDLGPDLSLPSGAPHDVPGAA